MLDDWDKKVQLFFEQSQPTDYHEESIFNFFGTFLW
jgi:hypothetical protein